MTTSTYQLIQQEKRMKYVLIATAQGLFRMNQENGIVDVYNEVKKAWEYVQEMV